MTFDIEIFDLTDIRRATGKLLPSHTELDETAKSEVYHLGKRLVYADFHQWYVNKAPNDALTAAAWKRGIDAIETERKRREADESRNGQTAAPLGTKAAAKAIG